MKSRKTGILITIGAFFVLTVVLLFGVSISPVPILIASVILDHPTFSYQDRKSLDNWDLPHHVWKQDLDGDGKNDLVSFRGCAYLSRANSDQISDDNKCDLSYVAPLAGESSSELMGEKYIDFNNLNTNNYRGAFYSYMFQNESDRWHIVVKENMFGPIKTLKIRDDGLLEPTFTPLDHRFHIFLYTTSVILLIPTLMML